MATVAMPSLSAVMMFGLVLVMMTLETQAFPRTSMQEGRREVGDRESKRQVGERVIKKEVEEGESTRHSFLQVFQRGFNTSK